MPWPQEAGGWAHLLLLFLPLALGLEARAESSAQFLPAGLVFPEFTHAIEVDPAALPYQTGSALQLEYAPALFGSDLSVYSGSYTAGRQNWGLGIGYNGWQSSSNAALGISHSLVVGGGVKIPSTQISLGLSASTPFLTASLTPTYNVSMQIGDGSGLQFALILYDVPSDVNTIGLGIGHSEPGKFALEGGLVVPFPTDFFNSGSAYSAYVAGAIFSGPIGASFSAAFTYTSGDPQSSVARSIYSPTQNLGLLWTPVKS